VIARRRENFQYLHEALVEKNQLPLSPLDSFTCPMVYPFMMATKRNLRKELIENNVFVAKYWPNVERVAGFEMEGRFANDLVSIPCDQRYVMDNMQKIIEILKI
jgi:hypothetical protein